MTTRISKGLSHAQSSTPLTRQERSQTVNTINVKAQSVLREEPSYQITREIKGYLTRLKYAIETATPNQITDFFDKVGDLPEEAQISICRQWRSLYIKIIEKTKNSYLSFKESQRTALIESLVKFKYPIEESVLNELMDIDLEKVGKLTDNEISKKFEMWAKLPTTLNLDHPNLLLKAVNFEDLSILKIVTTLDFFYVKGALDFPNLVEESVFKKLIFILAKYSHTNFDKLRSDIFKPDILLKWLERAKDLNLPLDRFLEKLAPLIDSWLEKASNLEFTEGYARAFLEALPPTYPESIVPFIEFLHAQIPPEPLEESIASENQPEEAYEEPISFEKHFISLENLFLEPCKKTRIVAELGAKCLSSSKSKDDLLKLSLKLLENGISLSSNMEHKLLEYGSDLSKDDLKILKKALKGFSSMSLFLARIEELSS